MKKRVFIVLAIAFTAISSSFGNVFMVMSHYSDYNGSQVTVPVTVANFTDILSVQGTIQFDPAILSYVSIQQFGLLGMNSSNFGLTQINSGIITFSWFDGTLNGVTLSDSSVIFSITYNIIGNPGQISPLAFVNSPTVIEVSDINYTVIPTSTLNGSVEVLNILQPADITLFLDTVSGPQGSQQSVSARAIGFININSIQGTIQFDTGVVTFSSISYFGLPGMSISSFGTTQASAGKITFSWADGTLQGIDMADSASLFSIDFDLTGSAGEQTLVEFVDVPTLVEVTDSLFNTLNTNVDSGMIRITGLPLGLGHPCTDGNSHNPEILQSSPNPFSSSTLLTFSLAVGGNASLSIIDLSGKKVFEISAEFPAGKNTILWNGTNLRYQYLPAGVYICYLKSGEISSSIKLILSK